MEHMEKRIDETFERVDAGASYTTSELAGRLTKGDFLMIRGRPCKVFDVSRKAPGKHGAAKVCAVRELLALPQHLLTSQAFDART